ncbi:hypothetical protein PMG71_11565 [Roseofilum sp. BLCC_M154]|uniref:Uncharacterized protein n=1 Tax=Roseofilum acuticapitatum BLCC-M154 TaxID=3022444 RepID=A0ABT7AT46_9CYAN|nr:hypothetical protein [Roseofilum acuticapitatum]MDJ1170066.1 hypothetical protein [Roseofilum acuticapitatum BLCC-M154]
MAEDIRQWLDQIRQLQEQMRDLQQECDRAYASAANWQRLYETEAQQRRNDTQRTGEKIKQLKSRVQSLQQPKAQLSGNIAPVEEEVENLSPEEMKVKLVEILQERDRLLQTVSALSQALEREKEQHSQTRQNLTSALGDAIERLNQLKNR